MTRFPENNGGFTLVEVVVAMMISLIGLVGLLKSIEVAQDHNLRNQMRDEAVQVAEDRFANFQAQPFQQISTSYPQEYVPSRLRGVDPTKVYYRVLKSAINTSSTSKVIDVKVRLMYKNMSTSHEVQSIRVQDPLTGM